MPDHFAVSLCPDRNDASCPDQRQQDFHLVSRIIAEYPGIFRSCGKLRNKDRYPLHSTEAVLKPADPGQERCADGKRQYTGSALKAVSPAASLLDNQYLIPLTEPRIAYLCVFLHVVKVCKLSLSALAAETSARLRGPHKKNSFPSASPLFLYTALFTVLITKIAL